MHDFDEIRSHLLASGYKLTLEEPFVLLSLIHISEPTRPY